MLPFFLYLSLDTTQTLNEEGCKNHGSSCFLSKRRLGHSCQTIAYISGVQRLIATVLLFYFLSYASVSVCFCVSTLVTNPRSCAVSWFFVLFYRVDWWGIFRLFVFLHVPCEQFFFVLRLLVLLFSYDFVLTFSILVNSFGVSFALKSIFFSSFVTLHAFASLFFIVLVESCLKKMMFCWLLLFLHQQLVCYFCRLLNDILNMHAATKCVFPFRYYIEVCCNTFSVHPESTQRTVKATNERVNEIIRKRVRKKNSTKNEEIFRNRP